MTKLRSARATLAVWAMFVAACGDGAAPAGNTAGPRDTDPDVTPPAPTVDDSEIVGTVTASALGGVGMPVREVLGQ